MRVPLKWLSDYVDFGCSPGELAKLLTRAGLEVERIETFGAACEGVVAGRVVKKEQHPNADRLSVCEVSTGEATHRVVCGAPNVREGGVYPFAPIGAELPGGFKIKRAKLRGVESAGMLCSAKELGISEDAEGLMDLPADVAPGAPLETVLGPPDAVLELGITANRPDCLGLYGIAREVAALTGKPLKRAPAGPIREEGNARDHVSITLECPEGCPRYSSRVVRGVKVGPSPEWMQRYLQAAGLRPISNVVDITNFVMLETGHPMHAFDARFLEGSRIVIRWAREGERLTTLDDAEHLLDPRDVVIADGERGVALGGIMGGKNSEIREDTTDVVLEVAYFDPVAIRKTARRLRLHTDSSHRFERGCDPDDTLRVVDRAAWLLQEHAGGTVAGGQIDCYPRPIDPRRVRMRPARVDALLGTSLGGERMAGLLRRLEMRVEASGSPDALEVTIPTFRPDIEHEADLAEEVARQHGYGEIASEPPLVGALPVRETPLMKLLDAMRQALTACGLDEAVNMSFAPVKADDTVVLAYPLTEESAGMRSTIAEGLVATLELNLRRQSPAPWLFELGRVFSKRDAAGNEYDFPGLPHQPYHAAFLVAGSASADWRGGARAVDFHTARGVIETAGRLLGLPLGVRTAIADGIEVPALAHSSRRAGIYAGERCIGWVAELSGDLPWLKKFPTPAALAELNLERLTDVPRRVAAPTAPPSYPKASRDLAFLLPREVRHEQVESAVRASGGPCLESVSLFDVFTGKNLPADKKSVAFSLAFRHPERTLQDQEIESAVGTVVEAVRKLGGELR